MKIILFLLYSLVLACASAFQQTTSGGPPKNFLICDCLLTVNEITPALPLHTHTHLITQGIADTVMIEQSPLGPKISNEISHSCSHTRLWTGNIFFDLGVAKRLGGEHHRQRHRSYVSTRG